MVHGVLFVWPTVRMMAFISTKSPLISPSNKVSLGSYEGLWKDRLFWVAAWSTL